MKKVILELKVGDAIRYSLTGVDEKGKITEIIPIQPTEEEIKNSTSQTYRLRLDNEGMVFIEVLD